VTPHTLRSIKSAERAHLSGYSGCCFFQGRGPVYGKYVSDRPDFRVRPSLMKANFAFSGDLFTMACRAERP